ncbi:type II secretion system protein J [Allomuricauda sp. M10]|uniref:PulJ/GspJ family protein n=1 Tax=Allomuricauda sp. M10 TaxID=2683292 RepID=UPI001D19753B|nr:prepilin-type N-terminal cleavage/methylation domain-containing protein [Muricauda sp. M10]
MDQKIKAFTLNEMLVVLLITSLVVGMAYSVLRLVQLQMQGISGNYERNTELNLLRQSLWVDFNQCDRIWFDPSKNELVMANELKQTIYLFQEDEVIKDRDTFSVKITSLDRYFNGKMTGFGEIDALDLYTSKELGDKRIFVFKRNATTTYMNQ